MEQRGAGEMPDKDGRQVPHRPHDDALLERLLRIAGDLPRHIAMQPSGPQKYIERPNRRHPEPAPVTAELLRAHLAGEITLGAWLASVDRLTRAVLWDADSPTEWHRLLAAGRRLLASGAKPIIERSPAKGSHAGGGHLWLVFREPVDPRAARATAEAHAPELGSFPEFWPRAGAVRLLGGYYRRGETSAWCEAAALRDPDAWLTTWDAAALAWSEETSSEWVTAPAPTDTEAAERYDPPAELDTTPVLGPPAAEPDASRDRARRRKYGANRASLPWAVLPRHIIAWFNRLNDVRTILPKQANGYALATWRNERTPSVGYVANNRWRDYGARRTRTGGDAFEAYVLTTYGEGGHDRALAALYREFTAAAGREFRRAAAEGSGVPAWVAEVMGPEAWTRYGRSRARYPEGGTATMPASGAAPVGALEPPLESVRGNIDALREDRASREPEPR